ncbi:hypothetical protein NDU88_000388 [Pleurodeles waltl]|uniref:Uncharacterized protein n=1 Tax=Pleurodeles waltl TaxID=8319 RepID=A0AAV7V4Y5_PLEWA|nr:hypothetical protein NDU88_000388 [Pleurodeles waltl]
MAPRTSKPISGKVTPAPVVGQKGTPAKKRNGKGTPKKIPSALVQVGKGGSMTAKARKMAAGMSTEKAVKVKSAAKRKAEGMPEEAGSGKKIRANEGNPMTFQASLPSRNKKGELVFEDFSNFRPNMTPKEVLQAGSFGGTYFRPIYSGVTKQNYKDVWRELPKDWLEGLDIPKQVASAVYREDLNTYKVKCGGSLDMWESHGWITPQDPYGWFQWFCRFYQGRRTLDDQRQIGRWDRCTGKTGRWRGNLISKIVQSGCAYDNKTVSPVVRQTLQHWGYRLTPEDYEQGAKKARKRMK